MTRLPTLRLLNISLELQSIPLVHAERMSHFDCMYPFDNTKSETARSFSGFELSSSITQKSPGMF
jgi:hypothetical protein